MLNNRSSFFFRAGRCSRLSLVFIALFLFCFSKGFAATRTSTAAGGNWATGSSWVGGVAPATGDAVIIATTGTGKITVAAAATCIGVTINAGATLVCTTFGLTVNGAWTNNGTFTQGSATVTFGGTSSVNNGSGTANFNNVALANAANFTINDAMTVAGSFTFPTASAATTATISGNNSLDITGAVSMPRPSANVNATLAVGAGTLTVSGAFTMSGTTGARADVLSISTGTATIQGTITVGTTACLVTFTGAGTLNINGATSGGPASVTPSTGTISFGRAGVQTVWPETYNNLTLNGSGTKTTTTVTVGGTLSMRGTATVSAAPTYSSGAALEYNTTTGRTAGAEWLATFAATGGVTISNTGAITLNGNKVFSANVPLTVDNGATLTTGAFDLTFNGNFINNGNWTASSGDVIITGTATQSIGGFNTSGLLSCTKTSGTATMTDNFVATGITKSGGGTLNLGSNLTHTTNGVVTLTAGTLNGGTNTLLNVNVVSATAWNGTASVFTAGTGTVNFGAAGNQTMSATGTEVFNNLTYSGSGTKTNATYTVNGTLEMAGTAVASAAPTYGANAALLYNRTASQNAGVEWLATTAASGGVTISNTGTVTLTANKVFGASAPFTIEDGATFNAAGFDMTFNNDFIINGAGTWTANSGDVILAGTGNQSIAGFTTTGLFSMTKTGGTATMQGNANANGFTLNGAGGTLDLGAGLTHTFNGTYTNSAGTVNGNTSTMNLAADVASSGGAFVPQTGTVNFTGNIPQAIPPVTWYNLGFSGTGLKQMVGEGGANTMTIEPGATVDMGSFTFIISGPDNALVINGNGVLQPATSLIGFTNAGNVNIPAINYYNLYGSTGGPRTLSSTGVTGIAAAFTPGGGSYIVTGSTVDFNGTIDQIIPDFTFNKLIVSNAGIKKILAAVTVNCLTIDINDNASVEINADGLGKLNVTQP